MSRKLDSILLCSYDAESLRIDLTQGAYYHLSSNLDAAKRDTAIALTEFTLAFEHEVMHWYQDIGTLLGMEFHYCHESPLLLIRNISQVLQERYPTNKIELPLYPISHDIKTDLGLADLISHAALFNRMWDIIDGETVFDDYVAAELFACAAENAEDPKAAFNYWLSMSSRLKKKALKMGRGEPSSPIGPANKPIGARALQEGQARAIEEMTVLLAEFNGSPIGDNIETLDSMRWTGIYRTARDHMKNILGWKNFREMTKEELFGRLYLFSAICDLAMATPICPKFYRSWADNYSWKDFHPGWRFHKLCSAINFLGLGLPSFELKDYNDFISPLIDFLRWEDANSIYSKGAISDDSSILEMLSDRFSKIRQECSNIMVNPFITNHEGFSELLLAIPPPLCEAPGNYRGKIKGDELLYCMEPPLRVKGFDIDNSYALHKFLKVEKYGPNLVHQIIWTGKKPKNVPQSLLGLDPVMLITGISEDRFAWVTD